ncbi:MAG: cobalt-precorrin-5B (C(1))-methyltransferase [Geminicoccaceae bacterium]
MTGDTKTKLKRGWTTGACATAATAAAFRALVSGRFAPVERIALPRGGTATFEIVDPLLGDGWARASVIKDAGDDPDVTHGATIVSHVTPLPPGHGVRFKAGAGVGTITRPGLPLAVGEPAINPVPRQMMIQAVRDIAHQEIRPGDVEIEISVPGGEDLAQQTLNPRLGIVGGLSILGTTGVVIPYSCAAWLHSIHRGIDVAWASGIEHIAASTGSTSERAVRERYDMEDMALIEMGDMAGGLLKYLRRVPLPMVTIAGGFAKLAKLAGGKLDLHSRSASVDLDQICAWANAQDTAITQARSAGEALAIADDLGGNLALPVAERARDQASRVTGPATRIEVIVYDRFGHERAHARGW